MSPTKRGASARGRQVIKEEEPYPASSPLKQANGAVPYRGVRGRVESPTKASQEYVTRKPRTSEDVRAEAFPIIPRGRSRPSSNKGTPVASKFAYASPSPSRLSRRFTEQYAQAGASLRTHLESQSSNVSRMSSSMSPMTRRGRVKSETEPVDDPSEGTRFEEPEGREKRKRKLTEAAEATLAQFSFRKNSRRISERSEQHLDEMNPEELTEPIEDIEGEEVHEEIVQEEIVTSPHNMYMQSHYSPRSLHPGMGAPRTRGMHVVSDDPVEMMHDALMEDENGLEGMVAYDEDGNMIIGYDADEIMHEEIIEGDEEEDDDEQEQRELDMLARHDAERGEEMQRHEDMGVHHYHQEDRDMKKGREGAGQRHEIKQEPGKGVECVEGESEDDDDDKPPVLTMEEGPRPEEILMQENLERGQMPIDPYEDQSYMQSPGGTTYMTSADEEPLYMTGTTGGSTVEPPPAPSDLRTVEFNFLDNRNVCCGLCGDIVPYENLLTIHLPMDHPEVYGEQGMMDLEEISYDAWLKEKLYHEKKSLENGFRNMGEHYQQDTSSISRHGRNNRILRRVSQVRVNPGLMTLSQLEVALKKKMIEKMGRKVKVSLVDKQHARCGICNAVVSLNKKFEIVHLVRHFNAWHPSQHRCAGAWPNRTLLMGPGKPLSAQDFAVVDQALDAAESLQCIWCGMFMDRTMLAMHFHEVHPEEVEVPKCHLCLQEIVINARLLEKYGQDFGVTLPDEHHIKCRQLDDKQFSTESAMDKFIERRKIRMEAVEAGEALPTDEMTAEEEEEAVRENQPRDPQYSNSRMSFGRRNKPKRNFIMPSLRQAIPQDSRYVEAISEGEWRCKMCGEPILAAVISAGAIKHYRTAHPAQVEEVQYELCKARLERVSDGCMEFVNPELVECLICSMTYSLHKPYNICRGIRHLKTKHPHMMPEYHGAMEPINADKKYKYRFERPARLEGRIEMGEFVDDPEVIKKLKQEYDYDFDKVQAMYTAEGERVLVLVTNGQEIDEQVAENIQASILDEAAHPREEEEREGQEEGVIVESQEYQMDEDMVVRGGASERTVSNDPDLPRIRNQMIIMDDVEEEDPPEGGEGEHGIVDVEEELAEETTEDGHQYQ